MWKPTLTLLLLAMTPLVAWAQSSTPENPPPATQAAIPSSPDLAACAPSQAAPGMPQPGFGMPMGMPQSGYGMPVGAPQTGYGMPGTMPQTGYGMPGMMPPAWPTTPGQGPTTFPNWQERDSEELKELVEGIKIARLTRQIGLDDEKTVILMRRFDEFKEASKAANQKRDTALKQLKQAVGRDRERGKAKEKDQPIDPVKVAEAYKALREADHELSSLKLDSIDKLTDILDPTQQARLYLFMQEFEKDMRDLIDRARSRMMGGSGMGMMGAPMGGMGAHEGGYMGGGNDMGKGADKPEGDRRESPPPPPPPAPKK